MGPPNSYGSTPNEVPHDRRQHHVPQGATILLAGATGDLGGRIAHALRERGARVKALVRRAAPGPG
jgi:NADPH-dependent 2,4-dienoyl-CoA reductase/sulfur reductase-like enzyme